MTTIHLIGNAHLDPVWLWDWREGLNEGIATCQAMADLLEEFPEVRFVRGEMAVYEHVEQFDPALFARIRRLVQEGRWDVVGGTYVQADENLPATEVLVRQFAVGKRYFRERFDVDVTTAWAADCFGHAAGMPEIFAAAGMDSFAFTRPWNSVFQLEKPAFWWMGTGGARILCYRPRFGWYGTKRHEIEGRLDHCLQEASESGLDNVACFYGLGNHGGGPTRVQLRQIAAWAARHPGVRVEYSGLHRLFSCLRQELEAKGQSILPEIQGELNFCLRGCSATMARFKFPYRRAEAALFRAERTSALIAAGGIGKEAAPLTDAWRALLFNSFHDILPGTSIERAYDYQIAQLGEVYGEAQRAETGALIRLAKEVNTVPKGWSVPEDHPLPVPVLVWNPHPWSLRTHIEIEVPLDYCVLENFKDRHAELDVAVSGPDGAVLPAQRIAEEHDSMPDLPWRWRVVLPVELPPCGWKVFHMGMGRKGGAACQETVRASGGAGAIDNKFLGLSATVGAETVRFSREGAGWLGAGLGVRVYEDPWGSWGGMREEPDSWQLTRERERWRITAVHTLEAGPERAAFWVRFAGATSRCDLTFMLTRGSRHVEVRARVLWNERSARLKLVLPCNDGSAIFDTPGSDTRRGPCGEVPGGRWAKVGTGPAAWGFASDALYGFDTTEDEFRATIVRSTRYGGDVIRGPEDAPWKAATDLGEHRFNFMLAADSDGIPRLAKVLEEPPVVLPVPASPGTLEPAGSLLGAIPETFELLAVRGVCAQACEIRVRNHADAEHPFAINWCGTDLDLGTVPAGAIATWRLTPSPSGWSASAITAAGKCLQPEEVNALAQ